MFRKSTPAPPFDVDAALTLCSAELRLHLAMTVWLDDQAAGVFCAGLSEESLDQLAMLGAVKRRGKAGRGVDVTERYHWLSIAAAIEEGGEVCPQCGDG